MLQASVSRTQRFLFEYRKGKTKVRLPWPITTGANTAVNQSEFEENACEKSRLGLLVIGREIGTSFANQSEWTVK